MNRLTQDESVTSDLWASLACAIFYEMAFPGARHTHDSNVDVLDTFLYQYLHNFQSD
jgi:hypothetical protein